MNDRDFKMPDTLLPLPVDLDRVEEAVDALGYQFLAADDRLIMPWPNHRLSLYFGQESGLHLTMLARMRMTLDLSTINEVAQALTRWNSERIGPAAMLHVGNLGEIEIQFRSSLSVDEGVSTDQLMQFIQLTINTVEMAVDTVIELFSDLDIDGAGSEELRTEQDENDLMEEITGLFVPPSLSSYGFEHGHEGQHMDSPRHPSSGYNDDADGDFSDEFFHGGESSGRYDDIWDPSAESAETPVEDLTGDPSGNPTPAGGTAQTSDSDDEHTPARETPDEPFLPIFSEFAADDTEGATGHTGDPTDDADRDPQASGDDGEEDLLDLLASLDEESADTGDTEATDPAIPAIAEDVVHLPAPGADSGSFHHREADAGHLEYPREVTLDRVRDHLADIGVVKTSGEEDFLVAWINEVFIGFFIDNGPTFLVKGHWDPDMDPDRDFMKLFMICNQWNERSLTTKAFCHKNSQGLQVRVEFAVPTAEGLTDDQLRHNIALSIHHLLQAVDSLSTEATGSSIVDWPEPN